MTRVIEIPIVRHHSLLSNHVGVKSCARIWCQNVKRRGRDSRFNRPINRAAKDITVVSVQSKDKAAIDHDSQAVETSHNFLVVTVKVLSLVGAGKPVP